MMKIRHILIFISLLISSRMLSQEIIKGNDRTYFVFKYCEFISNDPDCFKNDIPRHIRANQTDTVTYILDKKYKFYKGKCDTICKVDSVELYASYLGLYSDFEDEAYSLCAISEGLTNMNEVNLTIGDTNKEILRFTYFSSSTPISVTIVKGHDSIIVTQRGFNGEFISPESEKYRKIENINTKKWKKLLIEFETIANFQPIKKFNIAGPDLLLEIKNHDSYSCFYINKSETNYIVPIKNSVKKIEKLLNL